MDYTERFKIPCNLIVHVCTVQLEIMERAAFFFLDDYKH